MRVFAVVVGLLMMLSWAPFGHAFRFAVSIPLPKGDTLPAFAFVPDCAVNKPLPAVIHAVGVGALKILQHHDHCQQLANRGFFVLLVDPSNYPLNLAPGPYSWDKGLGYALGSVNQTVVAARLFVNADWYFNSILASVNYLCMNPQVDSSRIALAGFSQPANAALTYACRDPRIKAVIWNYGGWPWVFPYDVFRLPPVLIFHGDKDDVYDVKYAKELAQSLTLASRPFEMYIYPGKGHLFNIYYNIKTETRWMKPALLDSFERLVCFLNRYLQIPQQPPRRRPRHASR